jgi:hypothetical protein
MNQDIANYLVADVSPIAKKKFIIEAWKSNHTQLVNLQIADSCKLGMITKNQQQTCV